MKITIIILTISHYIFRSHNATNSTQQQFQGHPEVQMEGHPRFGGSEVEYYNDLPGKSPPEFSTISQPGFGKDAGSSTHVRDRGTGFRQRPFRGTNTT